MHTFFSLQLRILHTFDPGARDSAIEKLAENTIITYYHYKSTLPLGLNGVFLNKTAKRLYSYESKSETIK